jgi:hypothetical protein
VTAHPKAEWLARQLTEACGWDEPPRYLIRDRDGASGAAFIPAHPGHGHSRPTGLGAVDHVVVGGERHLIGKLAALSAAGISAGAVVTFENETIGKCPAKKRSPEGKL